MIIGKQPVLWLRKLDEAPPYRYPLPLTDQRIEQALFHRFIKLLSLEDTRRFEGVMKLAGQENVAAFTHKRVAL
jgi:hypothetical protein